VNRAYLGICVLPLVLISLAGAVEAVDYCPMFAGQILTYKVYNPLEGEDCYTVDMSETKEVNGVCGYVCRGASSDDYWVMAKVDGAVVILEEREDGVVRIYDTPLTWLIANPTLGSTWDHFDGEETTMYSVVAVDETVVVPAGVFTGCIKVKQEGPFDYCYHWLAPNVGVVKFDDEGDDVRDIEELVSYSQGVNCDDTPPTPPVIITEGAHNYGNATHAAWISTDAESAVIEYQIALSTTPDSTGIIPEADWTCVAGYTDRIMPGLSSLVDGATYYLLARARNANGLWSNIGVSTGITYHLTPYGDELLPLAVNNAWFNVIDNVHSGQRRGSVSLVSPLSHADTTWFKMRQYRNYRADEDESGYLCRSGNDYLYAKDVTQASTAFARLPLTVGKKWTVPEIDGGTATWEVLADGQTVTTPAGTFTGCIKVSEIWSDWPNDMDEWWWKPGVGWVLQKSYDRQDSESPWEEYEARQVSGWRISTLAPDLSAPTTPVVADDGLDCYGRVLRASYSSTDPESQVVEYQVAISSTGDVGGILPSGQWRSAWANTRFTSPSLPLVEGQKYYVLVKARNTMGLWSEIGASDGIIYHPVLPTAEYFPLHVGNFWRYVGQDFGFTPGIERRFVVQVTASDETEDGRVFTMQGLLGGCEGTLWGVRGDGLYTYQDAHWDADEEPWKWLSFPLYEGQTNDRYGEITLIEELHDTVSVPAGTFADCLRFRLFSDWDPEDYYLFWHAPGVGLVKLEIYGSGGRQYGVYLGSFSLCADPVSPGGAKLLEDGLGAVLPDQIVSAVWDNCFYLEDESRVAGIRVEMSNHGLSVGRRAYVAGVMGTNSDGERFIDATTAQDRGSGSVQPLGLPNYMLGGADCPWQMGITGARGVNNIGLLVKTWGRVTASGTDPRGHFAWFYVDDGSGIRDGTGEVGVFCRARDGVEAPYVGAFVDVTGISSCEYYGGSLVNVLIVDKFGWGGGLDIPPPPPPDVLRAAWLTRPEADSQFRPSPRSLPDRTEP